MISGDFRSAVHAAAQEPWRTAEVVRQIHEAPAEATAVMLQYAREALRGTPQSTWKVLDPIGAASRRLWNEVARAVALSRDDDERIARVVWLLWEHRDDGDEWEALRDSAAHALEGAHAGNVSLPDVVTWMTSAGEQEATHEDGQTMSISPSAWFRGGWAWCVVQQPATSPFLYDENFQSWPLTATQEEQDVWMIDEDDSGGTTNAALTGGDPCWDDHTDTAPIDPTEGS